MDRPSTEFMKRNFKISLHIDRFNRWLGNYGYVCWKYLQYQWSTSFQNSTYFQWIPVYPPHFEWLWKFLARTPIFLFKISWFCRELNHIYPLISLPIIIIIMQLAKQSANLWCSLPDCQYCVRLLHYPEERCRFVKDRANHSRTHGSQELVLSLS